MKTILLRFADNPEQAIARMGPRVVNAQHLGVTLLDEPRSDLGDHSGIREQLEQWRVDARAERMPEARGKPSEAPDGAGRDWEPTELQEQFGAFVLAMREKRFLRGSHSANPWSEFLNDEMRTG